MRRLPRPSHHVSCARNTQGSVSTVPVPCQPAGMAQVHCVIKRLTAHSCTDLYKTSLELQSMEAAERGVYCLPSTLDMALLVETSHLGCGSMVEIQTYIQQAMHSRV